VLDDTGFWRDRPTLVTGATGLLGGWLVARLLRERADVVCLVRDWVPRCELVRAGSIDRVKVVRGDIREAATLERAVAEHEIDTVFHLAAQTTVEIANRRPAGTLDANIRGTWCVLEACRRTPTVRQVVLASSDKAYGAHEELPYAESLPLQGRHPYDVSKSCADLIGQAYAVSYGLPVAITRCGNLYGGGDLNWNRIVPGTIRSALRGQPPVIRSDGSMVRDYVYVEDGVTAYLRTAQALAERPELRGEAFNFGSQAQVTVLDLVSRVLACCGREDLRPRIEARAANEIPRQYLDSTMARTILGWQPEFSLEAGLSPTVAWYREFLSDERA
jgi:CDP-glucose 4,6-dehydratase